jgi:hypothetical protein
MWMGFRIHKLFSFVIVFGAVDSFLTGATNFQIEIGVL